MAKKISLLDQAYIEEKRRRLKQFKSEFDLDIPFVEQVKRILPEYDFKPKQKNFINAKQFTIWYLGGYKSGKSFTGICKDIWLAYVNRPYAGMLVHPTADGIQLTIIPLIEEISEKNKIEFEVKRLSTKWIIYFKFGLQKKDWGQLILASGDVPKSLKGPKLVWGHIDEPLIMKKEITQIVHSRMAESRGKFHQVLYTGTPEPEHMQWGFDIVDTEEENIEDRFITTMSARDIAEFLRPGYIEDQEANLTAAEAATFIDGKYRNLSQGKVYHAFDRDKNTFENDNKLKKLLGKDNEYVLSYDFNVNQMSAVLQELNGRLKIQREEYRIKSRSDTRELTEVIIQRMIQDDYIRNGMMKNNKSIIITGDSSGKSGSTKSNLSDYQIIQRIFEKYEIKCKIYVPDSNPSIRDRVNYVNMQFDNETYYIDRKCKDTIRDRELTSWKLGADGFFVDKSKKELTHLSDAADYGIWNTQIITERDSTGGMIASYGSGRW